MYLEHSSRWAINLYELTSPRPEKKVFLRSNACDMCEIRFTTTLMKNKYIKYIKYKYIKNKYIKSQCLLMDSRGYVQV